MYYQQPYQQAIQQPIQQPQQMQNGGFVVVPSEDDVLRYPVALGNLVTFKIENQPIVIEKSRGFSQFEAPKYERYKLIKEEMPVPQEKEYLLKSDYETTQKSILDTQNEIFSQIEDLKRQFNDFKKPIAKKKEVEQ